MTSSSSSAGGPLGHRQVRSLYPGITENHLRYLEKWGLLRHQSHVPRELRQYTFPDLQTIKQLAAELERGTPLRIVLRSLDAERQGQMQLDFQDAAATSHAPRAKVVALDQHRARREALNAPHPKDASLQFPFADPQSALAAKYFVEGSRLDDGEEHNMESAARTLTEGRAMTWQFETTSETRAVEGRLRSVEGTMSARSNRPRS